MKKITIIGATGSLGRVVTKELLDNTNLELILMSRSVDKLDDDRIEKVVGSVFEREKLERSLQNTDLVFVALSGDLLNMISAIIDVMNKVECKRIIFISSYGIYGELPGQNGEVSEILKPYRYSADILEKSGLDYTILRPAWFDNSEDISYTLIPKGEIIYKNKISRKAIANFIEKIVNNPTLYVRENLGIVR